MMLSEANDVGLALIIGVGLFWAVNFCLRLAGHRLYWQTLLDPFPWVAGVGPVVLLSDRPDHRAADAIRRVQVRAFSSLLSPAMASTKAFGLGFVGASQLA